MKAELAKNPRRTHVQGIDHRRRRRGIRGRAQVRSGSRGFLRISLASRTKAKCDDIARRSPGPTATEQVDADKVPETVALIKSFQPDLVVNVALPYQDLHIMDACLETGVDYLDTANYEPPDEAKFEYSWQWEYHDRFKERGIMALLGSGFDPGVTNVFTAHAAKNHFDEIQTLDIIDCNAGDHGQPFATNFNPEINIREIHPARPLLGTRRVGRNRPARLVRCPTISPRASVRRNVF